MPSTESVATLSSKVAAPTSETYQILLHICRQSVAGIVMEAERTGYWENLQYFHSLVVTSSQSSSKAYAQSAANAAEENCSTVPLDIKYGFLVARILTMACSVAPYCKDATTNTDKQDSDGGEQSNNTQLPKEGEEKIQEKASASGSRTNHSTPTRRGRPKQDDTDDEDESFLLENTYPLALEQWTSNHWQSLREALEQFVSAIPEQFQHESDERENQNENAIKKLKQHGETLVNLMLLNQVLAPMRRTLERFVETVDDSVDGDDGDEDDDDGVAPPVDHRTFRAFTNALDEAAEANDQKDNNDEEAKRSSTADHLIIPPGVAKVLEKFIGRFDLVPSASRPTKNRASPQRPKRVIKWVNAKTIKNILRNKPLSFSYFQDRLVLFATLWMQQHPILLHHAKTIQEAGNDDARDEADEKKEENEEDQKPKARRDKRKTRPQKRKTVIEHEKKRQRRNNPNQEQDKETHRNEDLGENDKEEAEGSKEKGGGKNKGKDDDSDSYDLNFDHSDDDIADNETTNRVPPRTIGTSEKADKDDESYDPIEAVESESDESTGDEDSENGSTKSMSEEEEKQQDRPALNKKTGVRRRRRFTEEEKQAIRDGVKLLGFGKWANIKAHFREELSTRTNVNIKDAYRTMSRNGEV